MVVDENNLGYGVGSFDDLYTLINFQSGDVVYLNKDYKFDDSEHYDHGFYGDDDIIYYDDNFDYDNDSAYVYGISLSKTIIGNNHVIDGSNIARAFNVIGANVSLSGITFRNCAEGAVHWAGSNGSITNCSFVNCPAAGENGGAVYWNGIDGSLSDCSFTNCSVDGIGAAVCWDAINGSLSDCSFVNCFATCGGGGAVYWCGSNGSLSECSFELCGADDNGGAIYWEASNGSITDCSFVNCLAGSDAGAIYFNSAYGAVEDCSFVNCSSTFGAGAIEEHGTYNSVIRSSFVNCSSEKGDCVIYFYGNNCSLIYSIFENCHGGKNYSDWKGYPIVINKADVNLSAVYDNGAKQLVVSLVDATTGGALKGAIVVVNIGGVKYKVKINSIGQGKLSLADFDSGNYGAALAYKGNAKYSPANADLNWTVVNKDKVNLSAVYNGVKNELVVTLVDANNGNPLKGANVIVNIGGAKYNIKIMGTGQGKLSLVDFAPGDYSATATYKGNAYYKADNSALDFAIIVKDNVNLSIVYNGIVERLIVTLFDANTGTPLSGANVVVNINNENYNIKISSKGKGILSLVDFAPGDYAVTATYKGNEYCAAASTDLNFTIVAKKDANLSIVYNDVDKKIIFTLVDATTGSALKGAKVGFTLYYDGLIDTSHTVKIDSRGVADYYLGSTGLIKVSALYTGNANYNEAYTILWISKD